MNASQQNITIQRWVAALSLALLGAKLTAYYLTNSVAILSDALESIVNVIAGFFGLYSLYLSAKPADDDHPYGHGKIEFISAALEGSMIFMAGVLIIYQSIKNLIIPSEIHQLDIGMLLIGATGLINYLTGYVCVKTGMKNNSLALIASGRHLQSDTYTTIGVLAGTLLTYLTGILWIDSITGILFSGFILYTGYKIVRSSVAGIMDESDKQVLEQLVTTFNKNRSENWIDLHNARIIKYGNILHLDCHLTVPWYFNINEAHVEVDGLAELVKNEFNGSIELFVHSDGCMEFSCKICSKKNCPVRLHDFKEQIKWTVGNISKDKKHGQGS